VLDVDPDRDQVHDAWIDAGLQDDVPHLGVRDLDRSEALRRRAKGLGRPVELGVSRRPGPPVQIRRAEPMRRLQPARPQCLEMTREEDGLLAREPGPLGRSDVVAKPACRLLQVTGVLVDGPRRPLADGEQARVRLPATRSGAHVPARNGSSRRHE
jgi:hypothetical protein